MKEATEIESWLKSQVSQLLSIPVNEIDSKKALTRYGLDSSAAIGLACDLEVWLGISGSLDPTVMYDYPSIDELVSHLTEST